MMQEQVPTARQIAYRALCLGAMLKRNEFEIALQKLDDLPISEAMRSRILDKQSALNDKLRVWIQREQLDAHFSPRERDLIQQDLGAWSVQNVMDVAWWLESAGGLLWALGGMEKLPAYDQRMEAELIMETLDIFEPVIDLVWLAQRRKEDEIQQARSVAKLWHWRAQTTQLVRRQSDTGDVTDDHDFTQIIRSTAKRAHAEGHLPILIRGDFPAFGKAYAHVDHAEFQTLHAIAHERHFAFNWLCGFSVAWDDTPTDT